MTFKVIIGKNDFLVQEELSRYTDPLDFDCTIINDVSNIGLIKEAPFFSTRRTVVLKDFELTKETQQKIINCIEMNLDSLLIIVLSELRKDNALYKLAKLEKSLIEFEETKQADINKFIDNKVTAFNIKWSSKEVYESFKFFVGDDFGVINSELQKFENKTVNESDLDSVTVCRQIIVFDLIHQLISKDYKNFYISVEYFLKGGQDLIALVTLLIKRINQLVLVKSLDLGPKKLALEMNISPYVVKILIQQSKKFSLERLMRIYVDLEDLLYNMKIKVASQQPIRIVNILSKEF